MRLPTKLQARSGLSITIEPIAAHVGERFLVISTAPGRGEHRAYIGCTCRGQVFCNRDHLGPYVRELIKSYRIRDQGNAIAARNAARIREAAA